MGSAGTVSHCSAVSWDAFWCFKCQRCFRLSVFYWMVYSRVSRVKEIGSRGKVTCNKQKVTSGTWQELSFITVFCVYNVHSMDCCFLIVLSDLSCASISLHDVCKCAQFISGCVCTVCLHVYWTTFYPALVQTVCSHIVAGGESVLLKLNSLTNHIISVSAGPQ